MDNYPGLSSLNSVSDMFYIFPRGCPGGESPHCTQLSPAQCISPPVSPSRLTHFLISLPQNIPCIQPLFHAPLLVEHKLKTGDLKNHLV